MYEDPCLKENVALTKTDLDDIVFQYGQDPLTMELSFSDTEGGDCWAAWSYNLFFADTMEQITDIAV